MSVCGRRGDCRPRSQMIDKLVEIMGNDKVIGLAREHNQVL